MTEQMQAEPTPRLLLSEVERDLIDSTINEMVAQMKRNAIVIERPILINDHPVETKIIDNIIEKGVDKVRATIKSDFFEKIFDRLGQRSVQEADDNNCTIGMLFLRFVDSFKLVFAYTKRYRGKLYPKSEMNMKIIQKELSSRGLWKKG